MKKVVVLFFFFRKFEKEKCASLSWLKWSKLRQERKDRVTQSIWVSVSHKSRCNPALVLRLSLVGLVYSGKVDLQLPPALSPSLTTFSFSLSKFLCLGCPSISIWVFHLSHIQHQFWQKESSGSDVWVILCVCMCVCVGLWSIRCGGVDFSLWWPKEGLLPWLEANRRERERDGGGWGVGSGVGGHADSWTRIYLIYTCLKINCFNAAYRPHHLITKDKL